MTAIFIRRRFSTLTVAAGVSMLGCSGTSPAANPNPYGIFDATADDASVVSPEGGSTEANPEVDAGPDATTADHEAPDVAAEDASMDGGTPASVDATGPEGGAPATDAGADTGAELDAGDDDAEAGPGPDAGHPTFTSIYSDILTPNCLRCHAEPPPIESNLEMRTQQEAYGNLVGVAAMGDACGVKPPDGGPVPIRVIPGDAADSLLYLKITHTQKCGSGMPLDSDPLTAYQILVIETWIDQGAAND